MPILLISCARRRIVYWPIVRYLSVQDFIWINHKVTGHVHQFQYSRLEDGVYYQYGYGNSKNIIEQSAALLAGFGEKQPFERGNCATAWVGFYAFAAINGATVNLSDDEAASWFSDFVKAPSSGKVAEKLLPRTDGAPSIEQAIEETTLKFPKTIRKLLDDEDRDRMLSKREVLIINQR